MYLILIPILFALILAAVNLVFARFRLESRFVWLANLGGSFAIWGLILAAVTAIPAEYKFYQWLRLGQNWQTPVLNLDPISWSFAFGMASVLFLVEMTLPARETQLDYLAKAGNFSLFAAGIFAVISGNLIALILGWAAIDLIEFLLLAHYSAATNSSLPLVRGLSFRMAGLVALLLGLIIGNQPGASNSSVASSQPQAILLLLAVGLRLGVMPLNLSSLPENILQLGSGTLIRVIPAAASLVLLSRASDLILPRGVFIVFAGLTLFAGIYAGLAWVLEEALKPARPYWVIGMASLSFAAALLNVPSAAAAWALALVFGGAVLFIANIKRRWFMYPLALSVLLLAGIPFSPTWPGSLLYDFHNSWVGLLFLIPNVLLLAGYLKFAVQDVQTPVITERWRTALYNTGFIVVFGSYITLGVWSVRIDGTHGLVWVGILLIILPMALVYLDRRFHFQRTAIEGETQIIRKIFSLGWVYQILWLLYHQAGRMINLISGLIEGESGTLWSILLLVVLLSLIGSLLR